MKAKNLKLISKNRRRFKSSIGSSSRFNCQCFDIANLKKNKIFLMQLNRFMWEDVEKGVFRKNKRIRTF